MADIFLSYNEKDREVAHRVAAMLGAGGWTVWWDRRIPAGETWRSVLEDALENMRCMVVLWSQHSIESEWVYEEATEGRRLGKLVPVLIEPVRPPAGFREIQAADLSGWDGSNEFEGARMLVADLELLLGKPGSAATNAISKSDVNGIESPDSPDDRGRAYDDADLGRAIEPSSRTLLPQTPVWAFAGAILLVSGAAYVGLSWRTSSPDVPPVATSVHEEAGRTPLPVEPTQATPVVPSVITEGTHDATAPPASPPLQTSVTSVASHATAMAKPSVTKSVKPMHVANPRCTDLVARVQLGETLSDEAQSVYRKECL